MLREERVKCEGRGEGRESGSLLVATLVYSIELDGSLNPARLSARIRISNWVPGTSCASIPAVWFGGKD